MCCTFVRREQQCDLGIKAGQAGRQCLRLSGVGGEAFQDCCTGCKLGLQVGTKDNYNYNKKIIFNGKFTPFYYTLLKR